jgi:hypothetical protein
MEKVVGQSAACKGTSATSAHPSKRNEQHHMMAAALLLLFSISGSNSDE